MRLSLSLTFLLASTSLANAEEITLGALKYRISGCNKELRLFDSDISTAKIDQKSISVKGLPTLTLDLNGYVNDDPNQSNLIATIPLYTFGAQRAEEMVAEQKVKLSTALKEQKLQFLTKLVAENLTKLHYTRQKMTALDFYLGRLLELESMMENRARAGLAAEAELLEVANELSSKRTDLTELEKVSLEIQGELRRDNCGVADLSIRLPEAEKISGNRASDFNNNADLRVIDLKINVEKSEAEFAKTSGRPTLNARAIQPIEGKAKIGLSLVYTYENFGRSQKSKVEKQGEILERARRELASKETELRETLVMTIEQVDLLSQDLIPALEDHLNILKKTLESKLRLLDGGKIDVAEVVNAYQQMSLAELKLLDQKMNMDLGIITVKHMLGLHDS